MRLLGITLAIALPFLVRFAVNAVLPDGPSAAPSPPIPVSSGAADLTNNVPPIEIDTQSYGRVAVEAQDRETVRRWEESQQQFRAAQEQAERYR